MLLILPEPVYVCTLKQTGLPCRVLDWRGVRVVEGARLESVYTFTRIEGSNPSLSATYSNRPVSGLLE